jgi:hypothetical protein
MARESSGDESDSSHGSMSSRDVQGANVVQ